MKRTVLIILAIQGLLLLAFSPVWYAAIGSNQPIVDSRETSSADEGSVSVR